MVFPDVTVTWGPVDDTGNWALLRSTDPAARATVQANRAMITIAQCCTPGPGDDVIAHLSSVQARLGITRARAETYSTIGLLCQRMPALAQHLSLGMLSFDHLRMLARSTDGIHPDDTGAAEKALIDILSPRRQDQALHSPRAMLNRILKAIHTIDALARPIDRTDPDVPPIGLADYTDPAEPEEEDADGTAEEDANLPEPSPEREAELDAEQDAIVEATAVAAAALEDGTFTADSVNRRVSVDTYDPMSTVITATLEPAEAAEFMTILDAVCTSMRCNRADGLMHLARGTADVEVTLNIYREISSDVATTDTGHWLDTVATERFMERVTHLRIPGHDASESYTPTQPIRDFVAACYGTCTFPGCEVPAEDCDLDHIQRYNHDTPDDGGPTSSHNLHPLCRKHHLLKTLGWWDVTRSPDGAMMWTSINDGHDYITEPTGPLAGYARTTFAERASRRYRTTRDHNIRLTGRQLALRQALLDARATTDTADTEELPF